MTNYTLGGYSEIAAPADLRPYVDCLWTYALPAAAAQLATAHRVLQETGVSLCFVAGSEEPRIIFHGPVRTPRIYRPAPGVEVAAVRLKPEWSRDLLGLDPAEHVDAETPLSDARLADALMKAPHDAPRILIDHLRARLAGARQARETRLVFSAFEMARASRGSVLHVGALARRLHVSERQLRRLARSVAGMGPKYLQSVVRFNRTVAAADATAAPDWAALALEMGYYDQPHLIEHVRAFTGRTPVALHAERRQQSVRNLQD
jgi:AraC-like DNA-binding protein